MSKVLKTKYRACNFSGDVHHIPKAESQMPRANSGFSRRRLVPRWLIGEEVVMEALRIFPDQLLDAVGVV